MYFLELLSKIHAQIRHLITTPISKSKSFIENLIDEYQVESGTEASYLTAYKFEANLTNLQKNYISRSSLFTEWDTVREQLSKRNTKLVNFSKRKVESAEVKTLPSHHKIHELSTVLREAIVNFKTEDRPIGLRNFPFGSCSDSAVLLGQLLKDVLEIDTNFYSGTKEVNGTLISHAWLKAGKIIIDITADQFEEIDSSIWVTVISRWHDEFNSRVLHQGLIKNYDKGALLKLEPFYIILKDKINSNGLIDRTLLEAQ